MRVLGGQLAKFLVLCICLCGYLVAMPLGAIETVRYVSSKQYPDKKSIYFEQLLKLILEKTAAEFGPYQLEPVAIEMAQERTSMMLEKNEFIDITWRMTSLQLEQKLQAVYLPLLKGVMGYRIFIIRRGEQPSFDNVKTLEQLKHMTAGQGYNWADSQILKHNGFNLVEGYDIYLLNMLARKRFDYYPRALHEPWLEIADKEQFQIEQNLLLKYPSPIYFFVNKQNQTLAKRLSTGLKTLVDSGEFELFFQNHPMTQDILQRSRLNQRRVFELSNPVISAETTNLLNDTRLWIDPSKP